MKTNLLLLFVAFSLTLSYAQAPFIAQLTVPVQLNFGTKNKQQVKLGELSGISLLFLDTTKTEDEIVLMGHGEPVIWYDHAGESLKVTFIVPDSQATNYLELLYSRSSCSVSMLRHEKMTNDSLRASGNLVMDPEGYRMYLVGPLTSKTGLETAIGQMNEFFMMLHAKTMTRVHVKSWFHSDSLNVILGKDSQFDTADDLFWLDQNMRNRLRQLSVNAYSRLYLFENKAQFISDTLSSYGLTVHTAQPDPANELGIKGCLSFKIKADSQIKYLFLKPKKEYLFSLCYSFIRRGTGEGELNLEKISCKNLATGDFVEMELTDLVSNGIPLLYVDLIRGVVMEDGDRWDIANVVHAFGDVLNLSYLPNE